MVLTKVSRQTMNELRRKYADDAIKSVAKRLDLELSLANFYALNQTIGEALKFYSRLHKPPSYYGGLHELPSYIEEANIKLGKLVENHGVHSNAMDVWRELYNERVKNLIKKVYENAEWDPKRKKPVLVNTIRKKI